MLWSRGRSSSVTVLFDVPPNGINFRVPCLVCSHKVHGNFCVPFLEHIHKLHEKFP